MKKIIISLYLLITLNVNSQIVRSKVIIPNTDNHFEVHLRKKNETSIGFTNNIKTFIIRDINRKYKNPPNILWFIDEEKVTAYFDYNSMHITEVYFKNGYHILTRKDYEKDKLDTSVLKLINDEVAANYSVYLVTELSRNDYTIYSISLESHEYWCIVQVIKNDDENAFKITDKQILRKNCADSY
jgi:hypothetical protein